MTKVDNKSQATNQAVLQRLKAMAEAQKAEKKTQNDPQAREDASHADRVSLSQSAKAQEAKETKDAPENANWNPPIDSEDGSGTPQQVRVLRFPDNASMMKALKKAMEIKENDPMEGLPNIAIDHRARFFKKPEEAQPAGENPNRIRVKAVRTDTET